MLNVAQPWRSPVPQQASRLPSHSAAGCCPSGTSCWTSCAWGFRRGSASVYDMALGSVWWGVKAYKLYGNNPSLGQPEQLDEA